MLHLKINLASQKLTNVFGEAVSGSLPVTCRYLNNHVVPKDVDIKQFVDNSLELYVDKTYR